MFGRLLWRSFRPVVRSFCHWSLDMWFVGHNEVAILKCRRWNWYNYTFEFEFFESLMMFGSRVNCSFECFCFSCLLSFEIDETPGDLLEYVISEFLNCVILAKSFELHLFSFNRLSIWTPSCNKLFWNLMCIRLYSFMFRKYFNRLFYLTIYYYILFMLFK